MLFDEAVDRARRRRADELSGAILDLCWHYGGSITGEHGVGIDKVGYMAGCSAPTIMDVMQCVRCSFDPAGLANPGSCSRPRDCAVRRPGAHNGVHPLVAAGPG